jgi:hypothetical protein
MISGPFLGGTVMKLRLASLAAGLLLVASAQAQTLQSIKLAPAVRPNVDVAQVDQAALERAALEKENKRLREENAALKKRVDDLTTLGGSEVHAYCPNQDTSRNTAGAESDCSGAGGYTCEPVSGLCRTSCQTTDMCSRGYTCDTEIQQCVHTG